MSINDLYRISRSWEDGEKFDAYYESIENTINAIVGEGAIEWQKLEKPTFGALPSVIDYGQARSDTE